MITDISQLDLTKKELHISFIGKSRTYQRQSFFNEF